jgi:radical SAM protein with 4Fe4S-binding SPASM domain
MTGLTSYDAFINTLDKKPVPWDCLFELTFHCNLSCKHCYIVRKKSKELSKSEVFDILRQLKDMRCFNIIFSGGEIFTRKDFFEIAAYARKLNFNIILYTNGTLIDKDAADRIKELNILRVEISLYGFKKTHDKITRRKGSFDKTVRAIKLLVERKIKVVVKEVLMSQNISETWKLQKFVIKELGVKWKRALGVLPISPCIDGNKRPLQYRLPGRQIEKYMKEVIRQHKYNGIDIEWKDKPESERLCEAGFQMCNVSPYGQVNLCSLLRLRNNNSLRKRSFRDIWLGHDKIREFRHMRIGDRAECRGCEISKYCSVCPGMALLEKGSVLAKLPEACRMAEIFKRAYTRC